MPRQDRPSDALPQRVVENVVPLVDGHLLHIREQSADRGGTVSFLFDTGLVTGKETGFKTSPTGKRSGSNPPENG
jgi:hypothetical protein